MSQPTPYSRLYNFTQWSSDYPTTPHAGNRLDAELNAVKLTTDQILRNMALIQRDDFQLANMTVGMQQLKPELLLAVRPPTQWVSAAAYERFDIVWQTNVLYLCNVDHTAGVFATDLAAAKWTAVLDYTDPLGEAQSAASAAEASAVDAAASAAETAADVLAAAASAAAAAASAVAAASYLSSITFPIPVAQGGTGGSTEGQARVNLGLVIGAEIQAWDASLDSLSLLATAADKAPYSTAANTYAEYTLTAVGRTLVGQATQALTRTTGLGFTAAGDALVVAADAAAQRTLLALVPGTNVQAYDADLASWAGVTRTAYFDTLPAAADAAAFRTLLALGTAATVADNTLAHLAGAETFTGAKIFDGTTTLTTIQGSTSASLRMYDSGGGANAKYIDLVSDGGAFEVRLLNDALTLKHTPISISSAGVLSNLGFLVYNTSNLPGSAITWTADQIFAGGGDAIQLAAGGYITWRNAGGTARAYAGVSALDGAALTDQLVIRADTGVFLSYNNTGGFSLTSASTATLGGAAVRTAGKTGIPIPAGAMMPSTTSGAAYGLTETTTNKVMVTTYDFDPATQEFVHVCIAMPKGWNEGTVTAQFCWTAGNTGAVMWGFQGAAVSDDDPLDVAWGTQQDILDSVTAANDVMWTAETPALTIGGSPAEGDLVFFRFYRNGGNGSDTCAVDAKLIAVRLHLTTNAANDA